MLVNSVITYTTIFSDSVSGYNLATHSLTSSFCNHKLCNSSLTMEERYLHSTGINVTVMANDSRGIVNFSGSDPIKIGIVSSKHA